MPPKQEKPASQAASATTTTSSTTAHPNHRRPSIPQRPRRRLDTPIGRPCSSQMLFPKHDDWRSSSERTFDFVLGSAFVHAPFIALSLFQFPGSGIEFLKWGF